MNNIPAKVILDDLIIKFATLLSEETIKLIRSYGHVYGTKFTGDIFNQFITLFVESLVLAALNKDVKAKTEKQAYEQTLLNFNSVKLNIQDSVSRGFSLAFSKFNKQFVDYYCEIKPIGPAKNKRPC